MSLELSRHTILGPTVRDLNLVQRIPVASVIYHPCGEQRVHQIATTMAITPGASQSTSTMAIRSQSLDQTIGIAWKKCP